MKKLLLFIVLFAFSIGAEEVRADTAKTQQPATHTKHKKIKKKKLTRQQGYKLQKKAEKEGKQREIEARRREFLQMQEAQRRGIMQMHQHAQGQESPEAATIR